MATVLPGQWYGSNYRSTMNLNGWSFKYWIPAALISKWWLALLYNWYDTDLKQPPPSPTSRSLKSSMFSPEFNRLSNPPHVLVIALGPGFHLTSPDNKIL